MMINTHVTRALSLSAAGIALILLVMFPLRLNATASGPQEGPAPEKDIVEVAVDGGFTTLVAAVKAAGLVETLKGEGPFTVFAPTDEAFAKLPEGALENLLKPENKDKLAAILTYHVVSGAVGSSKVVSMKSAKTVQGSDLNIKVKDGSVMINDATVTATDIEATNGVIHVIDTVLMPPASTH